MDSALKQRLIGAGVLVLLAVIFLPMLVTGPAPDSSKEMQGVPTDVPAVPDAQVDSREMDFGNTAPVDSTPAASAPSSYIVDFGKYATAGDARQVVDALKAAGLSAATFKPVMVEGRTLQQIVIGPFATAADAESARRTALGLSNIEGSKVIALNAAPAPAPASVAVEPQPQPEPTPVAAAPAVKPATKSAPESEPVKPAAAEPAKAEPAKPVDNSRYALVLGSSPYPARSEALHQRASAAGIRTVLVKARNDKGQPIVIVRSAALDSREEAEALKAEVALKLQRTSQVQKL